MPLLIRSEAERSPGFSARLAGSGIRACAEQTGPISAMPRPQPLTHAQSLSPTVRPQLAHPASLTPAVPRPRNTGEPPPKCASGRLPARARLIPAAGPFFLRELDVDGARRGKQRGTRGPPAIGRGCDGLAPISVWRWRELFTGCLVCVVNNSETDVAKCLGFWGMRA